MNKFFIFMVFIMLISGCITTTEDYYYISFEKLNEVHVVNKKKVLLTNLEGNTVIPVQYELHREEYILRFVIGDASYFPHLNVSVESLTGQSLGLDGVRDRTVKSSKGEICSSYFQSGGRESFDFGWSVGCLSGSINKVLSFNVVDDLGAVVRHEVLPFIIKQDGKYTLADAL